MTYQPSSKISHRNISNYNSYGNVPEKDNDKMEALLKSKEAPDWSLF